MWKKSELNSEKIWKIWKKSELNSEKIWKMWKKSKLNSEKIGKMFLMILSDQNFLLSKFADFPELILLY
jgi:hypothetical protein